MPLYASKRVAGGSVFARVLRDTALQAQRLQVSAKTALYQPDEEARNIHFIHEGQVRTYQMGPNGSRRLIEILGTNEWCGAAALAGAPSYGEVAIAAVPTTVSVVAADRLYGVLARDSEAAGDLIRQLACKLGDYRQDASDLVFQDCNQRLVSALLDLSQSPAASASADGVVLRITHQQLAQKVGVARETISLALGQLRKRNLLRTGRNQLHFNPQTLRDSAAQQHAVTQVLKDQAPIR